MNALRGWFLNRGRRGTAQWEKGLGGQCSEVKRGPQHFHDFPRLIVMHGAHPARLAFKLSATSSLFLLRTFLPPSPSSFSHWRPFPLFLSLSRRRATPFQQFSSYVTEPRVLLLLLLFPSPFYFSPRSGVIRKRTCLRALARGGKTDTRAGSRANCLVRVHRDSAKTFEFESEGKFLLKMQRV